MIVSASRRTDIPAYYGEWMVNRLRDGYVLVPNPYNSRRLTSVPLTPDVVDCIVFWTKNPIPMLEHLAEIDAMGYRYYFQYTLNPYGPDVEPKLPPLSARLDAFRRLNERMGPGRVIWRYDPVLIDAAHPIGWHAAQFETLCRALDSLAPRCVFSFVDAYAQASDTHGAPDEAGMRSLAEHLAEIASRFRLPLYTCAEQIDLSEYGIRHGSCIDPALVQQIAGYPIQAKADAGQRPACGCAESVDIGMYDTCLNGCVYCYATGRGGRARRRHDLHDPGSPMLTGRPAGTETITERKASSLRVSQPGLFD